MLCSDVNQHQRCYTSMARSALEATLRQVKGGMVEVGATEPPGTYAQAPPL